MHPGPFKKLELLALHQAYKALCGLRPAMRHVNADNELPWGHI